MYKRQIKGFLHKGFLQEMRKIFCICCDTSAKLKLREVGFPDPVVLMFVREGMETLLDVLNGYEDLKDFAKAMGDAGVPEEDSFSSLVIWGRLIKEKSTHLNALVASMSQGSTVEPVSAEHKCSLAGKGAVDTINWRGSGGQGG